MEFFDDERGVSVQVGAVILLAFVVIAISTYQVQVVPNQNEEVEVNHNREVQERMQDLRDTVGTVPARGVGGSVAVPLGTRYPARSIFVNPPPPTGLLQTVGTTNGSVGFTVDNASALDGETADYWNGTARSFSTGAIVYEPRYNVYQSAPTTVYENSLAYNRFRTANITLTQQDVFDGNRITLTALDGEVRQEGRTASLTVRSATNEPRTVTVEGNASDPLTVTIPTTLSADEWERILEESGQYDQARTDPNANVTDVDLVRQLSTDGAVPLFLVTFELEPGTYRLRLAKAGVGTGVTPVDGGSYLTTPESTSRSVPAGGSETLTVEVRDQFNGAQSGVEVAASVDGDGSLQGGGTERTGDDGRARFTYDAPSSSSSATVTVNLSTGANRSQQVEFDLTVTASGGGGSGNGAYNVTWHDPENRTASGTATVNCSPRGQCTIQGNGESAVDLPMVMFTDPVADGASVTYSVSNSTVGNFSPTSGTTNSTGEDQTTLTVSQNGTVTTYVTSGAGGDRVEFTVAGVAGGPDFQPGIVYTTPSDQYLRSVGQNGVIRSYDSAVTGSVSAVGAMEVDFDGDGREEIPFVDENSNLKLIDIEGETQTLIGGSTFGPGYTQTRLGVGTYRGTGPYVFFVDGNNELRTVDSAGNLGTVYRDPTKNNPKPITVASVGGTGDIDGDGRNEITVVGSNNDKLGWVDPNGQENQLQERNTKPTSANSISDPADFIGADGTVEFVVRKGANSVYTVNATDGFSFTTANSSIADGPPLATVDIVGAATEEVIYIDQSGYLRYITASGTEGYVRDDDGNRIGVNQGTSGVA